MIKKLQELNNQLIKKYENDEEKLKRQLLIQKLLKEEQCFFKMRIETAFAILKDLNIPDNEIKSVYSSLIDIENYKENK